MSNLTIVTSLVSVTFGAIWFYTLIKLPPGNIVHSIFFLASLFFALSTAITMVLYSLALKHSGVHHRLLNPRKIMEGCFRRGGILSGVVTIIISLKILGAFNALNFFLLIVLAFLTEVYYMHNN